MDQNSANGEQTELFQSSKGPRFRLVHPYQPIISGKVLAQLTPHQLQAKSGCLRLRYEDETINEEFWRYCHRALDGAVVMLTYFLGGLVFVYTGGIEANKVGIIPALCLLLPSLIIDVTLHLKNRSGQAFTYNVARVRHALHFLAALAVTNGASWTARASDLRCLDQSLYATLHNGQTASPLVRHLYCTRHVNPFFVATLTFVMCTTRLDFGPHVFLTLINLVLVSFGYFYVAQDPDLVNKIQGAADLPMAADTLQDRMVLISVTVIAVGVSNIMAFARHRSLQRQFEASLGALYQTAVATQRHDAVDSLLSSMVPASSLEQLMKGERVLDVVPSASVLFSDMVNFTLWSSQRTPVQVVSMLSVLIRSFDALAQDLAVEKVKTIGDAYWAVTGIPHHSDNHSETLITFGLAMLKRIRVERKKYRLDWQFSDQANEQLVEWRVGIHSGPVLGGVLGSQQLSYEVFGETSTMANWIEQMGVPMRVVVSEATRSLCDTFDYTLHLSTTLEPKFQSPKNNEPTNNNLTVSEVEEIPFEDSVLEHANQEEVAKETQGREIRLYVVVERDVDEVSVSDVASARSVTTAATIVHEEATTRAQRLNFVQTQVANRQGKKEEEKMNTDAIVVAEIEAKYTKRKYCCGVFTFADPEAEEEFQAFITKELEQLRSGGIMVLLLVITLLFILFIADVKRDPSPLCLALWVLSIMLLWAGLGLSLSNQPTASAILSTVASLVLIIALFTAPDAGVANGSLYLLPLSVSLIILPNLHLQSLPLLAIVLLFQVIPLFITNILHVARANSMLTFLLFSVFWIILLVVMHEKRIRVQVQHIKVAHHFVAQQMVAVQAQEAIFATMVPDFVIEPLSAWVSSGFDPAKGVARLYEGTSVAFLRMAPPTAIPQDWEGKEAQQESKESVNWLFSGHRAIDSILATSTVVDKVKTVGDLVMVAGSFRGHSKDEAAMALLAVAVQVHQHFASGGGNEATTLPITVGLHCGSVMGIVLGYSRLTFDIFGDAVNTTSRVMTSPISKHKICASAEFLRLLPATPFPLRIQSAPDHDANLQEPQDRDEGGFNPPMKESTIQYGPTCNVKTKGKGTMGLRQVIHS